MRRRRAAWLLVLLVGWVGPAVAQTTVGVLDAMVVVAEGDAGTATAMFDVEVVTPAVTFRGPVFPVTVDLTTLDGTATAADGDYIPQPVIQLIFPADGVQTVSIDVQGDTKVEADETFTLMITNVSPGVGIFPGQESGEATIQNDDQTDVSIDDVVVTEGDVGSMDAVFTVSLSAPSDFVVSVTAATSDGSASATDTDYQPVGQTTVNFAPGTTSRPFPVTVNGDIEVEPDENFFVDLSGAVGAMIADRQGEGTIQNDDQATFSLDDVVVVEGDAGMVDAIFTVTLSKQPALPATVQFASSDGTATTADGDYQATSGMLTFNPGVFSQTATIRVNGDSIVEADESFFVDLSMPSQATIADGQGEGTIQNDDGTTVSIGDAAVDEGDSGDTNALLPVALSALSDLPVTVQFATRDGTATAGSDYRLRVGEITFAPGVTSRSIAVPVRGDTGVEPDEGFTVELRNPVGAMLGDAEGEVTIRNDDVGPGTIRLLEPSAVAEGAGSGVVHVERIGGAGGDATVDFTTADGTAVAGQDYQGAGGTLSWADGESGSRSFTIPIVDDNLTEGDETVSIQLANPTGATLGTPATAELVIDDDDQPAQLEAVGETRVSSKVGRELELQVLASREDGSPVQGAEVTWEVTEGNAELLDGTSTTSDVDGLATQRIDLGGSPGVVTVVARIAALEQSVVFEIATEGNLDELFDPEQSSGESSVARALDEACERGDDAFAELCDYLFGLEPGEQREVIGELTPSEAGALADLLLQAPSSQLLNLRLHLAARRGGGGSGSQLALALTGQNVPLEVLRMALAGETDVVERMAARIDAAMFQQAEEGEVAAESPPEVNRESRFSFFASGRVDIGDRPSTDLEAGFDLDTLGLTIGLDYQAGARLVVGGALGYVDTDTEVAGGGGGIDVRGYSLSGFATYFRDRLWIDGIVSYGWSDYDFRRNIDLPQPFMGQSRLGARARPEGSQLAVEIGGGYDRSFGATSLSSFGRLSYIDAEVDAFTEEGAEPFNLALRSQQIESLLLEAGIELVRASSRSWGVLQPVLRASALHEFEDDSRLVFASFAADRSNTVFQLPTDRPDRDFFRLGAGLSATLARGRGLYLLYETDLERDDLSVYRLTAGLRVEF